MTGLQLDISATRPCPAHRIALLMALLLTFIAPNSHADQPSASPSPSVASAETLFDLAADLLPKDPVSAKLQFSKAALAYEQQLVGDLSQSSRARLLYNAGASHQLAGDTGRAVLDFRRAELLDPGIPGLHDRLNAGRSAARGDTVKPPKEADGVGDALRDAALSIPRIAIWRIAIGTWIGFWALLLVRVLLPAHSLWRPGALLLCVSALVAIIAGGSVATLWQRDALAAREIVVLADTVGRSQPDDLTGAPSSAAPLKPGAELQVLQSRLGGNGQTWLRVAPPGLPPSADEPPIWIPDSSAARIAEPQP